MSKKILVTYFSASGETRQAAEELANWLHADKYEIEPQIPYTNADLNWNNKQSRSSVEMNDLTFRPAIKEVTVDLSAYDEIEIGFPIWWGIAPTVINTFIEQCDLTEKTVRAFATSGGSGIANCERSLQKQYPQINWETGKLVNSNGAIKELADMIQ